MTPRRHNVRRGFTLVEILIVVLILGILAAVVIASVTNNTEDAKQKTFVTVLRQFVEFADLSRQQTGQFIQDASSGVCPTELLNYMQATMWESGTPIGGVWDSELNDYGVISAIGVHFNGVTPRTDAFMAQIDATLDDGDLTTGHFRKLDTDRFYFVIAE